MNGGRVVMAARRPGRRTADKKEPKKKYLCPYCNIEKNEDQFYMSSDPLVMKGKTSM